MGGPPRSVLEQQILDREWFYEFPLPNGEFTPSYLPEFARSIHSSREAMLFDFLDPWVQGRWGEMSSLDLACHEGFFALKLAMKGSRRVAGVDVRSEHLEHAGWIQAIHNQQNLQFIQGNIENLDPSLGTFDIVLAFGILYHVQDLARTLRNIRAVTGGVCVIETQVAPELDCELEWGAREWTRQIRGCLALVDETEDVAKGSRETGSASYAAVPSLKGLYFLLGRSGFNRVELLPPGPDSHEQHVRSRRVMLVAFP